MPDSLEKIVVLKLSGSIFFSDEFKKIVGTLRTVVTERRNLRLVVISGGGPNARKYIETAKEFGADQTTLDEVGIGVSRLNAKVLASALGKLAIDNIPTSLSSLVKVTETRAQSKRIVVMGGLHPGQSTNAVGALVAEKLRAESFVNATDVDAVYTKDPRKFSDAKKLKVVSARELSRILDTESMQAGGYDLMDPVALKLIQRSKIETWIIKCNAATIREFMSGRKKEGTRITFNG